MTLSGWVTLIDRPSTTTTSLRGAAMLHSTAVESGLVLVAKPPQRHDVPWVGRVFFNLGAQALDVDVQRLGIADVVRSPHPVDQLHPREHASGVAEQHLEQLELFQWKLQGLSADGHDMAFDVHAHWSAFEHRG